MRFLTYQEYLQLGGDMEKESFERLEYRAEKIIMTRINRCVCIDEDIKRCTFELIDCLNVSMSNGVIGNVKRVSNDGYSVEMSDSSGVKQKYDDISGVNGILNTYLHKYLKPQGIPYV